MREIETTKINEKEKKTKTRRILNKKKIKKISKHTQSTDMGQEQSQQRIIISTEY
jgi:hypothetical protein